MTLSLALPSSLLLILPFGNLNVPKRQNSRTSPARHRRKEAICGVRSISALAICGQKRYFINSLQTLKQPFQKEKRTYK